MGPTDITAVRVVPCNVLMKALLPVLSSSQATEQTEDVRIWLCGGVWFQRAAAAARVRWMKSAIDASWV